MPQSLTPPVDWRNSKLESELLQSDLWVFAYGSLIWNPEFEPEAREHVSVRGFSRKLCIASYRYRGTKVLPGLVFGLISSCPQDQCEGVSIKVPLEGRAKILDMLWHRELLNNVYIPTFIDTHTSNQSAIRALAFVVDTAHPQYMPNLDEKSASERINMAVGLRGPNVDYVFNTHRALKAHGICDHSLEMVVSLLDSGSDSQRRKDS
ncbi:MAG: gamma-glutamylcyclotransferase [Gammaproteobacteria bacterium]|nr:gamma-glutamylcyclotransferase [Gammaproteobacteria bacterium]